MKFSGIVIWWKRNVSEVGAQKFLLLFTTYHLFKVSMHWCEYLSRNQRYKVGSKGKIVGNFVVNNIAKGCAVERSTGIEIGYKVVKFGGLEVFCEYFVTYGQ